ncbi:MAG: hydrogen peroxide-inducible genes activator [Odoribacteraceae bacterium]|jgi:LysR family hydrogen peroxide-inducible transcriptional activator|nr:hydrogen peroxide-inducible genes activator [Odoribacteraceae bacterium]
MITITQLEYIVAIDDCRHFAAAAERCFVTQPTLSMQVKKLEEDLGVLIFDRSRHPVEPTELGARLIGQARIVISSTRRINEMINEDKQEATGLLRVGIIPTLAPYLLPALVGHYARRHPLVRVEVEELVSREIIRRLKRESLDAGIFVTPYRDERIVECPVFYEEMLLYAHPGHELLERESIRPADLSPWKMWMLGKGHCFRDQVLNLCEKASNQEGELPFDFESNSLETLMKIVDREGGFTIIPELAALEMPREKREQVRSFAAYTPVREVSVIHSNHYVKKKLIALLVEELKAIVPAGMLRKERGVVVEWQHVKNKHEDHKDKE